LGSSGDDPDRGECREDDRERDRLEHADRGCGACELDEPHRAVSRIETVIWSSVRTSEMNRDGIPLESSSSPVRRRRRTPSNICRRRLRWSLTALRAYVPSERT
jgi:hypothetical protein